MKIIFFNNNIEVLIDDEDYNLISQYSWYLHKNKSGNKYARTCHKTINYKSYHIYMHHMILGKRQGFEEDHINGNGLDNRRQNLRFVTRSQNNMNRIKRRGTSNYKGVFWSTQADKWQSRIRKDNRLYHIGFFLSETDAAIAYDNKAKELFGEYAVLNMGGVK